MTTQFENLCRQKIKPLVIFLLLSSMWASTDESTCDVSVSSPGQRHTFIPQNSTVHINCTGESGQSPAWSVRLTETAVNLHQFSNPASAVLLNSRGFYEIDLPSDGSEQNVVQLLVNSTSDENNRTLVRCVDGASLDIPILFETTLVIYDPRPIFTSLDLNVRSINISWSPPLEVNQSQTYYYLLTVEGHNTFNESFQLNQTYYNFTAPEDAPPCEVYNFYVSAHTTYVGATYTGYGCITPGSKSTMLPSLPDFVPLESSLEYVLMKNSSKITFVASFMPANYCEQYPVLNYTLEVKGPSSDVLSLSVSPGVENVIHNMTENTIYSFKIIVSNIVGVVLTKRTQIFTTDVQYVTATPVESMDAFVVQCDFINGSNAQGCMVVLVGEIDNVTANLTRINPCTNLTVNETILSLNNTKVFAFDIESDGSVGTLAVPGVIMFSDKGETASCPLTTTTATTTTTTTTASTSRETDMVIFVIIGGVLAAITLIIITILCIVICRKIKRSKKHLMVVQPLSVHSDEPDANCSELIHCTDEELEIQAAEILYDQPVKARERCSGDGAELGKSKHTKDLDDITAVEREMNTYAELVEENHHYHTLEPQRVPHGLQVDPDAPALPPPFRPPSPEPLPAYQEIGSLQVAKYDQERDTTNGEIVNDQYQSSQNQPPPGEAQVSSEGSEAVL